MKLEVLEGFNPTGVMSVAFVFFFSFKHFFKDQFLPTLLQIFKVSEHLLTLFSRININYNWSLGNSTNNNNNNNSNHFLIVRFVAHFTSRAVT